MSRTLLDALADDRLLGASPAFKDLLPWRSWLDFLRAMSEHALDAAGLERFKQHTGRGEYKPRAYREAVAIVGRQSGKTRLASALVAWAAVSSPPVRDGERPYRQLRRPPPRPRNCPVTRGKTFCERFP